MFNPYDLVKDCSLRSAISGQCVCWSEGCWFWLRPTMEKNPLFIEHWMRTFQRKPKTTTINKKSPSSEWVGTFQRKPKTTTTNNNNNKKKKKKKKKKKEKQNKNKRVLSPPVGQTFPPHHILSSNGYIHHPLLWWGNNVSEHLEETNFKGILCLLNDRCLITVEF